MTILADRVQLAAKEEGTEGTAETLEGADALLVMNPVWSIDTPMERRPLVGSSLSPHKRIPGRRSARIEFDVELKGSGTAGTAPEFGKLLKMCGFGETVVAVTSVTYLPASTGIVSGTLAFYMDGVIKKLWGARGDVSLKFEDGKPGVLHFVFTGADFSVVDGAMLSSGVSYDTTDPIAFMNASLTIDSYAAIMELLEISKNNTVTLRPDINTESGYKSAVITKREPMMTFDPEFVTVATYDFYGKLRSGNEGALSAALTGTAGNISTITAPKVQYVSINPGEKEGFRTLGIDCQLNRNTGDDELSIAFT